MELTSPMIITTRLMAGAKVGGSTIHLEPVHRDPEGRVVWHYILEDAAGNILTEGTDLRSGCGADVDPREALRTLVAFATNAAESYRYCGMQIDEENVWPAIAEWAYLNESELEYLGFDLGVEEDQD